MKTRRTIFILSGLVLLLLISFSTVSAGWMEKVTGGGQAMAGSIPFSITVSACKDGAGTSGGQIQYAREGVEFHGKVACMGVFSGGTEAVAAGPGWNQEGSWLADGNWIVVNVQEGGVGAGDTVRVYQASPATAQTACDSGPSGGFPGLLYDGNFNIRQK